MIGYRALACVLLGSVILVAVALLIWPQDVESALMLGVLPIPGFVMGVWAQKRGLRPVPAFIILVVGLAATWAVLKWSFDTAPLLSWRKLSPKEELATWLVFPSIAIALNMLGYGVAYICAVVAAAVSKSKRFE